MTFSDHLASLGRGAKSFGYGVFDPYGGDAYRAISTPGQPAGVGDVAMFHLQRVFNDMLRQSAGPFRAALPNSQSQQQRRY